MNTGNKYPSRSNPRLRKYNYNAPGAYFVTVCTGNRECVFGNANAEGMHLNGLGEIILSVWNGLAAHYPSANFDSFVIMPNHVHGIIILQDQSHSLSDIVRSFKGFSSRRRNEFIPASVSPLWQRNYYEHVIRNDDDLRQTREYIQNNPLKWELDREHPGNQKRADFKSAPTRESGTSCKNGGRGGSQIRP